MNPQISQINNALRNFACSLYGVAAVFMQPTGNLRTSATRNEAGSKRRQRSGKSVDSIPGCRLIRNFEPDRLPAGTDDNENAFVKNLWYGGCDNGPTKTYMIENRDKDDEHQRLYELSFGKRPEFELFDLSKDPHQLRNMAADPEYAEVIEQASEEMGMALDAFHATTKPVLQLLMRAWSRMVAQLCLDRGPAAHSLMDACAGGGSFV